jgi:hypothetical protein
LRRGSDDQQQSEHPEAAKHPEPEVAEPDAAVEARRADDDGRSAAPGERATSLIAEPPARRRRTQYREITVGLTPAQYEYLREEARTRTTSIAQLVREMLQQELPRFPEDVSRE